MTVGRRPPVTSAEELRLWHLVVRDAVPLHQLRAPQEPPAPALPAPPPKENRQHPPPTADATRPARLDPHHPVDIDRRTWQRLRRGSYPIDARLDLHGLSQPQAHQRLTAFLAHCQARGNRCVLVITGRGLRHGGTLRAMTPRWLDEAPNRVQVIAFAQAQQLHGGDGALYVLLRRSRSGATNPQPTG